jgi:hypothetical protein
MRIPRGDAGATLLELVFALGVLTVVTSVGIASSLDIVEEARASGAARYVASRLYQARMLAVNGAGNVAVRFTAQDGTYVYASYRDGNRNGVLSTDIASGLDRLVQPSERLPDRFVGVDFGVASGLPAVEPGGDPPDGDPVKLGASNMVSFTALGTCTPGSLYVRGRRDAQYVVRVYGDTGKIRVLKFDRRNRQWRPV